MSVSLTAVVTMALSLQLLLTKILSCKVPMDVAGPQGVKLEALPGSRIHYPTLPGPFRLTKGSTLQLEFRPESRGHTGLIFGAWSTETDDVATASLHQGHLVFARKCRHGSVFEMYRKRLQDKVWHSLKYVHNDYGGELTINEDMPFRLYHMGPCASLPRVDIGGTHDKTQLGHSSWTSTRHSFHGCIRNLRLNGERPNTVPEYHVVSVCGPDE